MTDLSPKSYMLSVDEALERVLSKIPTMGTEYCDVINSEGRVLRENVKACVSQPPCNVSAMDGYAFCHDRLTSAGKVKLKLIGEARAGFPFEGELGYGETIKIFTGAFLPNTANTVIIQENILKTNDGIKIHNIPDKGKNIRFKGSDFNKNSLLVAEGKRITSRDIGLISAGNIREVLVSKKPRIGILSTGDELQLAGEVKAHSHIVNSNSPMLKNLINKMGGEGIELGIAR
ncbi:MAG: molybdopterin molybdotransferase MoeA, partial [Sphingomonadales bacterium]